jgi:hypothetical protein
MEALDRASGLQATPKNIDRVSEATSPGAARWAFEQWGLRKRAREKFARAGEMLFTREALEQATHEELARFHAVQFPKGALVADLTCGIGADLIALAQNGEAVGYEIDAERAAFVKHNLSVHGLEAEIRVRDCLSDSWDFEYAYADPSRRSAGKRTLNPDEFSPNPAELSGRMSRLSLGLLKLSPMLPDEFLQAIGPRLDFLSYGRECREAVIRVGTEAGTGRRAGLVESGLWLPGGDELPPLVNEPEEFLFEADPAAVRAHALANLCYADGLSALGDSNGYLTGSRELASEWMRCYHILWHGRGDTDDVRPELVKLNSATPVLKQRGAGLDLEAVKKKLRGQGTRDLAVAFYPIGKSIRAAILEHV